MTGSTPATSSHPTADASATPPQRFRHWLSSLDDAFLATVIRNRPDAAQPLPPGIDALATRLLLRRSVARALARCTAAELVGIEKLAAAGAELEPVAVAVDVDLPSDNTAAVEITRETLTGLFAKALVFPTDDASDTQDPGSVRHVQLVPEALPALPTGWSLLEQVEATPEDVDRLPADQRRVVELLARAGGTGTTKDAGADADPHRPIPQLLNKGLVQRVDSTTVRLPRAVNAALRGTTLPPIPISPSGREGTPEKDVAADEAAAGTALETVRLTGELIDVLGQEPVELLKDKTAGVRPLKQLAKRLDTDPERIAWLIDLGFAASLFGRGEPKGFDGNFLAPTDRGHQWMDEDLAARWSALATAWRESPWAAWEAPRALDPETNRPRVLGFKDLILDVFQHAAVPLDRDEFFTDLRFRHPLFAAFTAEETITHLLSEAEQVGLIAQGRASSVLLVGPAATENLTPAAVDAFIMQADMTILVPGPPVTEVRRRLADVADLESPGLASVYRLSEQSLRRGIDRGATAEELKDFFTQHAIGTVPQAVDYLLDDVARRHGSLRGGAALSYIRSSDPAMLADAARAVPELRVLAPTVAVSPARLGEVLAKLRARGFSPAAEDETGASITAQPDPVSVPLPSPRPHPETEPDVDKVIDAIRSHDEDDGGAPSATARTQPNPGADADLLRAAARGGRSVTLTYADKNGAPQSVSATPLSVAGGQVDVRSAGRTIRFPLHRISQVNLD